MPVCDALSGVRPVSEYQDLRACWERAVAHFGNTSRVDSGGMNATIAETHPIFVVSLAAVSTIAMPATDLPMSLDASTLPPGAIPVDERLSFQIVLAYPFPTTQAQRCPSTSLQGLHLELTDREQLAAHPLTLQISGCERSASQLVDLRLRAVGWGNPSFSSVSMTNASIISVAPSSMMDGQLTMDSLSWTEADLIDSDVRYFGDVEGGFGDSPSLGQNGSRAIRTRFSVEDPKAAYGKHYQMRKPGIDSNYQFSWYGAEWDPRFVHIEDCTIDYISDLALGSVNVTGSVLKPWLSEPLASPLFAGMDWSGDTQAPAFSVYNMGSDFAPQMDLGSYVTNSKIVGVWSVNLARSYFRNCSIEMADIEHLPRGAIVPSEWIHNETESPSWVAMLNSHLKTWPRMLNAFTTALDHCEICLRPAFQRSRVASGENSRHEARGASLGAPGVRAVSVAHIEYPAQRQSIEDSDRPGTSIGVCIGTSR